LIVLQLINPELEGKLLVFIMFMFRLFSVNTIRIFYLIVGLMIPAGVFAQSLTDHNWYFGSAQRDLRFSRADHSPSLVTNQQIPFGNGGSAVATDPVTGNVLFYTDGLRVYNWAHTAMSPGSALMGDPTQNQPVAICRIPGRRSQYYIFHRQTGVVRYTVVDVLRAGAAPPNTPPQGEIDFLDSLNQTIPAHPTGLSEAMAVIPHSNGTDFFLVTHIANSSDYVVLPITATGFGAPTTVTAANSLLQQAASFTVKRTSTATLIAVAPKEINTNVEVLTFDEAILSLTAVRIPSSGVTSMGTEAIYDTEFSGTGQYLYVSRNGNLPAIAPNILQFDLTDLTLTADTVNLPATVDQSFGLQMGPDSVIYHLYQDGANFLLGSFSNTDTIASAITYNPTAFAGNFNGKQFPSFAPYRPPLAVSFVTDGTCQNSPIAFYPTVVPGADSLVWDLGDGTIVTDWSPVHTYTAAAATVTVTAFLNGQSVTSLPVNLSLTPFDTQIQLVQDTTACTCELPFSKTATVYPPPENTTPCNGQFFSVTGTVNGSGAANWEWFGPAGSAGAGSGTSAQLFPDSAGYYYLIAQVGSCQAYAGVNIKEYGVPDQRSNIWYFGNRAGLDFNPFPTNPIKAIENTVMNAPEGTSTISDRNGQVVFFTDGDKVWGPPTAGFPELATGIGGDPLSTQSALIVPVPGDETLYYIFTTKEIYGTGEYVLSYSLFDRKVLPVGAVVQQNIELFRSSTERITASQTGWLIAHEYGNNTFRAYRVTAQGIGNPVFSAIGSDHLFTIKGNGEGYMKLGPQNRLAVAVPSDSPTPNRIEIFDFIDSLGTVTNPRTLTLTHPGRVYGLEFAAGGDKLFATLSNAPTGSRLYEFAFNTAGIPSEIIPTVPPAPNTNPQSFNTYAEELGAIQLAPDGQIYVAVNGKAYLGVIQPNASLTGISPPMTFNRPLFAGTTSTLGLPNFIQSLANPIQAPSLNVAGLCLGDSTFFSGSGTDVIDYFTWFVDGVVVAQDFNLTSYNHLFTTTGAHSVRLLITNRCVATVFDETRNFTINAPPPPPAPQRLDMCTPPLTLDANTTGTPGLTYLWATGATTETISVSTPGNYRVLITSTITQCVTDTMLTVSPVMPSVNLGNDLNQCSGNINVTLNTFFATPTHEWTEIRNNVVTPVGGNGNTLTVNLSTPGQVFYTVKITDPRGTVPPNAVPCFTTDTISFTIFQAPTFNLSSTAPVPCGASNGSFQVTVTQPAGASVWYYFNGSATPQDLPSPIVQSGLAGGAYSFIIQDQLNNCQTPGTVTLSGAPFNVNPLVKSDCPGRPATITTDLPTGTQIRYTILSSAGVLIENNVDATIVAGGTFDTGPLDPDTYSISVLDVVSGCSDGNTITINLGASVPGAVLTLDVCGATPLATATPNTANYTYAWSGAAVGPTPPPLTSPTAPLVANGPITLIISDVNDVECPVRFDQPVTLVNPQVRIDADASVCQPLPITATALVTPATGSYSYDWSQGPVGGPYTSFAITPSVSIGAPLNGREFIVEVTDLTTTCPAFQSPPQFIQTLGLITTWFVIDPVLPCEGNQFTITATTSRPVTGFAWRKDGVQLPAPPAPGNILTTVGGGTYTATADAAGLCPTNTDIVVNTLATDPGDLDDQYIICPDPSNPDPTTKQVLLDAGTGITNNPLTAYTAYQWYMLDDTGTPVDIIGATNQTLLVNEVGQYGVRLTSQFCEITDDTDVLLECEPVIAAPNAFRPGSTVKVGGQLTNNEFHVFTFFIEDTDFEVYIYNRWGEMVFHSPERGFRWNGGYDNNTGNLLPSGTYTYVVRYRSTYRPEYGIREKRGGVVLMR
jgi:hypothetical protein